MTGKTNGTGTSRGDTGRGISQTLSERFRLNLQSRYDLEVEKERLKGRLEEEVKVLERRTA